LVEAAAGPTLVVLDVGRTDPAVLDGLGSVKKFVVVANQELPTVRSASGWCRCSISVTAKEG